MKRRYTFAVLAVLAVLAALAASPNAHAQAPDDLTEPPAVLADTSQLASGAWVVDLRFGLGVAQSGYSNNWKSGDKGAFAWISTLDFEAERQVSPLFNWYNVAKLAYGETANQVDDPDNPGDNKWESPQKTSDQIYAESVGRFSLGGWLDPYAALRFDSYFQDVSDPRGALSFNPVTLKESAGLAHVFRKTDTQNLVSRLGFGFRQSWNREFVDALGASTETNMASDGGLELQTDWKEPVFANKSVFESQLLVFAPLFYSQSDELEAFDQIAQAADPARGAVADYWRVPNVSWRNRLLTKLTSAISFDLFLELVYQKFDPATTVDTTQPAASLIPAVDSGIRKGVQVRQTFSFGLSFDVI